METSARTRMSKSLANALVGMAILFGAAWHPRAQAENQKTSYPTMAPLNRYLSLDEKSEIALAKSAAPPSLAEGAEVMVLRPDGYSTAVKGTNGFVCIVERSWAKSSDDSDFWNPKVRAPICFNAPAARSFLPIFLMKTKLVLAGKSKAEIVATTTTAMDTREIPPLEPMSMCYMMSKQQYLGDRDKAWHPHAMFFVPGDAVKIWGADHPDSPVMAANDPEERVTTSFFVFGNWSDGTPAPLPAP
jgi:hypothetical protein